MSMRRTRDGGERCVCAAYSLDRTARRKVEGLCCLVIGRSGDIMCYKNQYQNQSHGAKAGGISSTPTFIAAHETSCVGV